LLRNGSSVGNPDTTVLAAEDYNYTYNTSGCTNYTSGQSEDTLTVNKKAFTLGLSPSTGSIVYGVSSTQYAECNSTIADCSVTLWRNNVNITDLNNSAETLGVGTWDYVVNTSRPLANYSWTEQSDTVTVTKADCDVDLWLNSGSVDGDNSIALGTMANGTGVLNVSGFSWELLRNGSSVDSGSGVLNESVELSAGTHNYTGYWDGNANYTGCSEDSILSVTEGVAVVDIVFDPSSSETYGTETNTTCYIDTGDSIANLTLYRNGTMLKSGSGQQEDIVTLGAGSYNYTCEYNASENYTTSRDEDYLVIAKAGTVVTLVLNDTVGNITVEREWVVNITANATNSQGTLHLYNDSVLITSCASDSCSNIESHAEDVGTELNITAVYNATENYTTDSKVLWIIVNNTIPTVPTLLTPIDNDYTAINETVFDWSDSSDPNSEQSVVYEFKIYFNNGSLKQDNTSLSSSTIALSNSEELSDGIYKWNVRSYDGVDYTSWTSNYTLTIDTINPDVILTNPSQLNSTIVNQSIVLDATCSNTNLHNVSLNITNGTIVEQNATTELSQATYDWTHTVDTSGWSEGNYTIWIGCMDWAGNDRLEAYNFTVDLYTPSLVVLSISSMLLLLIVVVLLVK